MNENETETTVDNRRKFEPQQYVTFDVQDVKNRVRMFNAHRNAVSLTKIGDEPIHVCDVMTEVGTRARSGNPCQNTYLFTVDGPIYFSQSNGVGDTINEIVSIVDGNFASNTSAGYVTVRMSETSLSGDRTFKQLELLEM